VILRAATLADGSITDVRITGELIAAVAPTLAAEPGEDVVDLADHVLLSAPAEPHAHLDKALTADRVLNPAGDLLGAIVAWRAYRTTLTIDDIAGRAETAASMLAANGVTAVRTHVDVAADIGTAGVEALVKVREAVADRLDLQIVALVSAPTTGAGGAGNHAALLDAIAAGADVVGGCPHLEADPTASIAQFLEIAAAADRPVDLHMDETLDPGVLHLATLAAMVIESGFALPVTASHCCSLGMQTHIVQAEVSEAVAAAGIAVVTLPQTNLYLQARGITTAPPRGLTAVRSLLDAGVTVAAGADNVQDPFNLVGRADPMETSALMVMAGHLSPAEAFHAVSTASRAALGLPAVSVVAGAPAELIALPAAGLREAIAVAPGGRIVVHRGRIVTP
jgi:cytosine deaminase